MGAAPSSSPREGVRTDPQAFLFVMKPCYQARRHSAEGRKRSELRPRGDAGAQGKAGLEEEGQAWEREAPHPHARGGPCGDGMNRTSGAHRSPWDPGKRPGLSLGSGPCPISTTVRSLLVPRLEEG